MTPDKILYVDDETLSLKYFERLVTPMAPVLTAASVAEARDILDVHGMEVAVLITDQRMPGERGNELLQLVRERYPHIVRMLTTAYSDLGEAVEAINRGEIFRYIAKPWNLENLRLEMRTALELASVRNERDSLLRDKLLVMRGQLRGDRLVGLAGVIEALRVSHPGRSDDGGSSGGSLGVSSGGSNGRVSVQTALASVAAAVSAVASGRPGVDWSRWDQSEVHQSEANRLMQLANGLQTALAEVQPLASATAILQWLGGKVAGSMVSDSLMLEMDASGWLGALLDAPVGQVVDEQAVAWLTAAVAVNGKLQVSAAEGGRWRVTVAEADPLSPMWLADLLDQLNEREP